MMHHVSRVPINQKDGATLFVFGDLQSGQQGFQKEAWQQFRNEFKATPNAWALGLGDYDDWLRPSMREALGAPLAKDDSARENLDRMVLKANDETIDNMSFLDRRLLLLHEGHHNWKLASGINTDQRIASALHATYGGFIASTRIALEYQSYHRVYTIVSTHGNANGRRVPAALSWLESNIVNAFVADHYMMGHGCKNATFEPFERQLVRREGPPGLMKMLPRCLIVGGFSRSYTDGWKSDYVERAGMSPQPPGWGKVEFRLVKNRAAAERSGIPGRAGRTSVWTLDVNQSNRHPIED